MAAVNFLYRSTKENAPLNLRLLFRHEDKDYVLGVKTKVYIYSNKELIENPHLSAKRYWAKEHQQTRPKDVEISNKQVEVNTELNKIENHILSSV